MYSVIRRSVMALALVGAAAVTSEAQGLKVGPIKIEEIRLDVANLIMVSDAFTAIGVGAPSTSSGAAAAIMPSSIALGIYLNDKIALEPAISFVNFAPDGGDATNVIGLRLAVPYYLGADRGKTGLFVAPVVQVGMITDDDTMVDFGVDFGIKRAMADNVSWSLAGVFRTGDTYDPESVIGARFGLSVFLR